MDTYEVILLAGWTTLWYFLIPRLFREGGEPVLKKFSEKEIRFDREVRRLQEVETLLRSVRRTRRRDIYAAVEPMWQVKAMLYTDFEFEWFLVAVVWESAGQDFYRYRLARSPQRREIEILETTQQPEPCRT